ncbi:MAG: hypothetical protein ABEK59_13150 [Halobacteria archaeon]
MTVSALENPTSFDEYGFTVKQSAVRKNYRILNSDGDAVFKAKPKLVKAKDVIPVKTMEDETVARIKARQIQDVSGEYDIIDEETGETIAVLDSRLDFLTQNWMVRDSENESLVAELKSRSKLFGLLRSMVDLMEFLPHRFDIYNHEGIDVGSAEGKFGLKDRYEVSYGRDTALNSFVLALTVISIDGFEDN